LPHDFRERVRLGLDGLALLDVEARQGEEQHQQDRAEDPTSPNAIRPPTAPTAANSAYNAGWTRPA